MEPYINLETPGAALIGLLIRKVPNHPPHPARRPATLVISAVVNVPRHRALRLGISLIVSILVHGAVLIVGTLLIDDIGKGSLFRAPFTANFVRRPTDLLPSRPEPKATVAPIVPPAGSVQAEKDREPARFTYDPDLSILKNIPVTISGSVTLELKISAKGKVMQTTVIRSDPAPKALIDGLVARFSEAVLEPARIGQQATESSLEVTVHFEPDMGPLEN